MSYVQYVRTSRPGAGTFIAVPSYQDLAAPFVLSLYSSLANLPHRMDLEIFSGNCHVDDSRNRLVRDFLETDCEQLVFLDSDVFWLDADLDRLIRHDRDIVAGIYPLKSEQEDYPVRPLPGDRVADDAGLVEVEGVPTGFLKIKRRVLETLWAQVPHHRSKEDAWGRKEIGVIFERTLNGNSRRGGDYEFCRKARKAGFRIYVDPMMQLGHQGDKLYHGCLGHFWRKDIAIPEAVAKIREGSADAATFLEMFNAWGNTLWSAPPELLFTATIMARGMKGNILDLGSGLTTIALAAAAPEATIYSFDKSPDWAGRMDAWTQRLGLKNVKLHLDGTGSDWYSGVPEQYYDLVVVDGPAGDDKRGALFTEMENWIQNAAIIVDDVQRVHTRAAVEAYCKATGRTLSVIDDKRPFGLII